MKIPLDKIVKEECRKEINIYGMHAYFHIKNVVKYANQLAIKQKADKEVLEIAAWLHDIGSVLGDTENHHIFGAKYAEKLLEEHNYPKDKIEAVKHCIISHRGSKNIKRETLEAELLADSDAMSHFDDVPDLFRLAFISHKMETAEAKDFVYNKLERSWKKLTPAAKDIIRNKYEIIKKAFE